MAFVYTADRGKAGHIGGDMRQVGGSFAQDAGDTGGAITTGLKQVISVMINPTNHINSAFPKYTISGGSVTIITGDGTDGDITFIGRGGG